MQHLAKVALGGAAGAAVLETLCKNVPRRGRGGGGPLNTLQKCPAAEPRRRQSLKHSAKAARCGATAAAILETLCKGGPQRCRGGGNP